MKLNKQICPVDVAIKLKQLGIFQQSIFYYVNGWKSPRGEVLYDGEHVINCGEQHLTKRTAKERGAEIEFVSAFTVAELGRMMPTLYRHYDPRTDDEAMERGHMVLRILTDNYATAEECNMFYKTWLEWTEHDDEPL